MPRQGSARACGALASYRDPGEGLGRDLLERAQAPWFYAVTHRPRAPEEALRLSSFPAEFLRHDPAAMDWREREELFWAQVSTIGA